KLLPGGKIGKDEAFSQVPAGKTLERLARTEARAAGAQAPGTEASLAFVFAGSRGGNCRCEGAGGASRACSSCPACSGGSGDFDGSAGSRVFFTRGLLERALDPGADEA